MRDDRRLAPGGMLSQRAALGEHVDPRLRRLTAGRPRRLAALLALAVMVLVLAPRASAEGQKAAVPRPQKQDGPATTEGRKRTEPSPDLLQELKQLPNKIIFESFQDGNWELLMVNADGSNRVNLTRTPRVNELYPHASRDGMKVCFVVDQSEGLLKGRSVYYMQLDGTGRTLVAKNAREPCWTADGKGIVYLKGEFELFTPMDYATKGIFVYDLATGKHQAHSNKDVHHLYNICCTPDGKWYVATVHAGMGCGHAILAIEAHGTKVFNLKIPGCRPDVSADGKHVAWGASDYELRIGDLDFSGPEPKVVNAREVVTSTKPVEVYHIDWSPDGRYVAYSRGPHGKSLGFAPEMVGIKAEGWNICVADTRVKDRWVAITNDGHSNKEPHWVPLPKGQP